MNGSSQKTSPDNRPLKSAWIRSRWGSIDEKLAVLAQRVLQPRGGPHEHRFYCTRQLPMRSVIALQYVPKFQAKRKTIDYARAVNRRPATPSSPCPLSPVPFPSLSFLPFPFLPFPFLEPMPELGVNIDHVATLRQAQDL